MPRRPWATAEVMSSDRCAVQGLGPQVWLAKTFTLKCISHTMHIYIYVYIYNMFVYMYICVYYIYIERESHIFGMVYDGNCRIIMMSGQSNVLFHMWQIESCIAHCLGACDDTVRTVQCFPPVLPVWLSDIPLPSMSSKLSQFLDVSSLVNKYYLYMYTYIYIY